MKPRAAAHSDRFVGTGTKSDRNAERITRRAILRSEVARRNNGSQAGGFSGAESAAVRTSAQVRALIAPARQEIVDVLDSAGPCSVSALAALLGRPADALYHHLRRLHRVGLIVESSRRKSGRHVFATYDLRERPLRITYDPPIRPVDVARVVAAAQRLSWREFRRSLVGRTGVTSGPTRTLWGARAKGWISAVGIRRVNQLLGELLDIVSKGRPSPDAQPVSISFLMCPSPPTRSTAATNAARDLRDDRRANRNRTESRIRPTRNRITKGKAR